MTNPQPLQHGTPRMAYYCRQINHRPCEACRAAINHAQRAQRICAGRMTALRVSVRTLATVIADSGHGALALRAELGDEVADALLSTALPDGRQLAEYWRLRDAGVSHHAALVLADRTATSQEVG